MIVELPATLVLYILTVGLVYYSRMVYYDLSLFIRFITDVFLLFCTYLPRQLVPL